MLKFSNVVLCAALILFSVDAKADAISLSCPSKLSSGEQMVYIEFLNDWRSGRVVSDPICALSLKGKIDRSFHFLIDLSIIQQQSKNQDFFSTKDFVILQRNFYFNLSLFLSMGGDFERYVAYFTYLNEVIAPRDALPLSADLGFMKENTISREDKERVRCFVENDQPVLSVEDILEGYQFRSCMVESSRSDKKR